MFYIKDATHQNLWGSRVLLIEPHCEDLFMNMTEIEGFRNSGSNRQVGDLEKVSFNPDEVSPEGFIMYLQGIACRNSMDIIKAFIHEIIWK